MSEPLLQVVGLTKRFGGLTAVRDLSFDLANGQITGLIGPNGAGKTTVFNMITGMYPPTSGKVHFDGADITGAKPHVLVQRGLTRTFQLTTLFTGLTVLENVAIAEHLHASGYGFLGSIARTRSAKKGYRAVEQRAMYILELVGLADSKNRLAEELPHGHQRLLEIAIALATQPRLLMLDEPATGMNVAEAESAMRLIRHIRDEMQLTILLIEHDMKVVMGICEHIVVISFGAKIAEGAPEDIRHNEEVITAYLGSEDMCLT